MKKGKIELTFQHKLHRGLSSWRPEHCGVDALTWRNVLLMREAVTVRVSQFSLIFFFTFSMTRGAVKLFHIKPCFSSALVIIYDLWQFDLDLHDGLDLEENAWHNMLLTSEADRETFPRHIIIHHLWQPDLELHLPNTAKKLRVQTLWFSNHRINILNNRVHTFLIF